MAAQAASAITAMKFKLIRILLFTRSLPRRILVGELPSRILITHGPEALPQSRPWPIEFASGNDLEDSARAVCAAIQGRPVEIAFAVLGQACHRTATIQDPGRA